MCRAKDALVNNFNKLRIAGADHPLRVRKAVHVNRDPAAVQKDEVRISDQSEMVRPVSLDEEFFRMPPKTEHLAMTSSELFVVYGRRLIRVHVRLAGVRTRTRLSLVYMSATLLAPTPSLTFRVARLARSIPAFARSWLAFRVPDSFHREPDPFQFRAKQFRLRCRELDQRWPHPGPFRVVRANCNRLFQRRNHRRKFPAAENFAHDV